jgi:hypothetical protein
MLNNFTLFRDRFYFIFALSELECNGCPFELCLSFSYIKLVFLTLFSLGWNRRFKKRILRSHRNIWALKTQQLSVWKYSALDSRPMKSIGNNIFKDFRFSWPIKNKLILFFLNQSLIWWQSHNYLNCITFLTRYSISLSVMFSLSVFRSREKNSLLHCKSNFHA